MGTRLGQKVLFVPGPVPMSVTTALMRVSPGLSRGTPYVALAQIFSKMEMRTKFTKALEIDIASLEDPTPNPALSLIKPAFIFRGPAGTLTVAPYGEVPDPNEALWNMVGVLAGTAAAFGVTGFLLGSFRQKFRARRRAKRELHRG